MRNMIPKFRSIICFEKLPGLRYAHVSAPMNSVLYPLLSSALKRLNYKTFLRLACCALGLAAVSSDASGAPGSISVSETPDAVQMAIKANVGSGKVTSLQKVEEDEGWRYLVNIFQNGQTRDLEIKEDGTLIKVQLGLSELPPVIERAIRAQLGNDTLDAIEKNLDPDGVTYEVEITTKEGRESSFVIGQDGVLLEMDLELNAAPPAVQKTLAAQIGSGTASRVTKMIDGASVTFEAEFTKDGQERSATVGSNGNLLRVEISLEEATPEAQKTIKEQVGNGRIVAVYKSNVKRDKVLPFQVESVKDGKPFDFSVGPKGRFLGMDE